MDYAFRRSGRLLPSTVCGGCVSWRAHETAITRNPTPPIDLGRDLSALDHVGGLGDLVHLDVHVLTLTL
jgi:hypothetical protein